MKKCQNPSLVYAIAAMAGTAGIGPILTDIGILRHRHPSAALFPAEAGGKAGIAP
ncbi:MAG: hypothetical protein PUK54_00830 [Firmicutes bacterium]|nr:hypothetical protein [Bacillota bacterium]MDD7601138.1 hypothetical protein [Bacillota bacterium]MDY5857103.1 hypothetical protein [Anaerovoracaceae bacterium]